MCPLMMDKDRDHVTRRILKLTLEIIYLLTGEEYAPVKTFGKSLSLKSIMDLPLSSWTSDSKSDGKILDLTNKIIELLTGEVSIRCEDITVSFTMEEWEYVGGHKDLYKDIIMEDPQALTPLVDDTTSVDTSYTLKMAVPCKSVNSKECPSAEDDSRNTSTLEGCESPLYSLDCTEEDFDISQDSSEKYYNLPHNQEDCENNMTEKEKEESNRLSQQNNEEENYLSDDSGEDEAISHDWTLEGDNGLNDCKLEGDNSLNDCKPEMDDLSKDCKEEVDNITEDCKQEVDHVTEDCKQEVDHVTEDCKQEVDHVTEDCKQEIDNVTEDCKQEIDNVTEDCKQEVDNVTEDCKQEVDVTKDCKQEDHLRKDCQQEMEHLSRNCKQEAKKLKDCKYEEDVDEQYYEEELLKDVKIEVVSDDDWEEETALWGEQERDLFAEGNFDDLNPDLSNNRMIAERYPQAFYPHCKNDGVSVPRDYQPPILPRDRAHKSNAQAMLNSRINNGTTTLNNINAKKCVRTFPPCQIEMSQFGSQTAQDHIQMGQQQKNINTARKTTSDIQTLQNFLSEMNENRKIEEIPHTELDTLLSKFILVVKRKDGNEYEPHTLRCMVGSIDRYLKEHSYNHTIIYGNSKDFPLTKQSLNAKIKFLKKIAESNPPIRQEALTDDDIENLYKTGTLSLDNPTSLLNLVFFNNGIHFALRTKEQYSLQWGDIKLKIDPRGNQYLEYSDRQTEMLENRKNVRQMKPRIYATPHIPDRDPVTAYLKYQSFRPGAMMTPDSPFYLAPNVNYNPAFSEWYRSTKIGIQKIRAMMTTMKIRASLPESKKKVSYITKRRLFERLPQHTLVASGAIVPTTQQNNLQSFNNKSTVMEMRQHKPAIIMNNLHTTLPRPSQERLPTTSSIHTLPSTSRYGELPVHKRSFMATEFAQQRNSNMYLNNYRYLTSEEPAKKRKPVYDFKKE